MHPSDSLVVKAAELTLQDQVQMVEGLRLRLQRAESDTAVQTVETHISFVLVAADYAYKLKKAINPGFLDFTTLERRRHYCAEELRLNRRLAPQLYLGVVPITGSIDTPQIDGTGPAIDYAVKMHAFAQQGLWDRIAARGELQAAHIDALVQQLHAFHRDAAAAPADSAFGNAEQIRAPMLENLEVLGTLLPQWREATLLAHLQRWEAQAHAALRPAFTERQRSARVRECHGDLHLGNVAQIDGRTTIFDCIEFNDAFRWIDVMSELAFMTMDLHGHGRPDLAHRLVNGYLEASGDYHGARVLRYYMVYRALVRAKIAALRAGQQHTTAASPTVRGYLALARRFTQLAPPLLMITHGLSGSGKSTFSQALLERTGAIRIRADVERKRLFGLDALARSRGTLNEQLYSSDVTRATYARLLELAAPVLEAGYSAILDATYLRRSSRDEVRRFAAARQLRFVILDLDVDHDTLRERVRSRARRADDASEADLAVLESQIRTAETLTPQEQATAQRCPSIALDERGEPVADWSHLLRRLARA